MSFQFKENNGFSAFALYNALKLHFTSSSYDYFKYHGTTNISENTFLKRKDKYSFYKLSRKFKLEELKNYYVANFLQGDTHWVGELLTPEAEENYRKWQKRNQSLTYQFEQDIIGLFNSISTPNEMLVVIDGQYPILLKEVMEGTISIETLVILNDIMNFLPMWKKKIQDDVIWPEWQRKVEKYTPFVNYDKVKFKSILKESLKDYA